MENKNRTINMNAEELKNVKDILEKYIPKYKVVVFGSRLGGKVKPFSDLDLAIMNDVPLDFSDYVDLKNAFEDSDLSIKIDVVEWANLTDAFKHIILKNYHILQEG